MIRRLDPQRLQNILTAFTRGEPRGAWFSWRSLFRRPAEKTTRPAPGENAPGEERRAG